MVLLDSLSFVSSQFNSFLASSVHSAPFKNRTITVVFIVICGCVPAVVFMGLSVAI